MVRDLESLIEYLYLKSICSDLLDYPITVNPVDQDNVLNKVCIVNKPYPNPNFRGCSKIIFRTKDKYIDNVNPYIRGLEFLGTELKVLVHNNIYYFSNVPTQLIDPDSCYEYLNNQLLRSSKFDLKRLTE